MTSREGSPAFTWRDYLFGKNIIAGSLQALAALGLFFIVFGMLFSWAGR